MATEILRPNEVGDLTEFNPQPGLGEANYEDVDEEVLDSEDIVYIGTDDADFNAIDLYGLGNHSTGSGTINSVKVCAMCDGQAEDTTVNLKIAIKTGGTLYLGAEQGLIFGSYSEYSQTWAINPKTELAWTWDDIDALQAGLNSYAVYVSETAEIYLAQIYVEIDYTETPPDTTPPVITRLGDVEETIEVGDTYNDAGATALDETDGDITENIVTVNPVNVNVVGVYTVTYNVSDAALNPATEVTRTVNVVDTTIPVITRLGEATVNLTVGDSYEDDGATASDNYDGDITDSIVTVNPVNTAVANTYTVTYNVVDSSSNPAVEVTRTVIVSEAAVTAVTQKTARNLKLLFRNRKVGR